MTRPRLSELVRSGRRLVSDGAWGTFLQAKGLQPGECPELWNVERHDDIADIARAYIEAGADIVETNSFGANRVRLADFGLADRDAELNEAAARLSRQAAGENRHVIGSIGPTGRLLMLGDIAEADVFDAFAAQAAALERGGVDAFCIETMAAIDEAQTAIRAAKSVSNLEIICTFTFQPDGDPPRTMMGHTPAETAQATLEAGADIIGANCGNGIAGMVAVVRALRAAAPDAPILVHANAGLPVVQNGAQRWPESPADMAARVADLLEAGASIIGGCCGTTPAHIRAIRAAVDRWRGAAA